MPRPRLKKVKQNKTHWFSRCCICINRIVFNISEKECAEALRRCSSAYYISAPQFYYIRCQLLSKSNLCICQPL